MNWKDSFNWCKSACLILIVTVLVLAGCSQTPLPEPSPTKSNQEQSVALWIDDAPIMSSDFINAVDVKMKTWLIDDEFTESEFNTIINTAITEMVHERILRKKATEMNISIKMPELWDEQNETEYPEGFDVLDNKENDWEKRVRNQVELMMISKEISTRMFGDREITVDEVEEYYTTNIQHFTQPQSLELRVIRLNDLDLAKDIQQKVRRKWKFTTLAENYSNLRGTGARGQVFTKNLGEFPKDFLDELLTLKPGQTSKVLTSQEGYFIYRMIKKHPEVVLPFDEVKDTLQEELQTREESRLFQEWLKNEEGKVSVREGTPIPYPGERR